MLKTPTVERYANGQVIITEGIISSKAYIVIEGNVRISKKVGNRNVAVGTLKAGDVFGEMGLFQEKTRSATATAKGEVTLGIIDKEYFHTMLDKCPDDMKIIINSVIDRLRITTNKLAAIGLQWENAKRVMDAYSIKEKID